MLDEPNKSEKSNGPIDWERLRAVEHANNERKRPGPRRMWSLMVGGLFASGVAFILLFSFFASKHPAEVALVVDSAKQAIAELTGFASLKPSPVAAKESPQEAKPGRRSGRQRKEHDSTLDQVNSAAGSVTFEHLRLAILEPLLLSVVDENGRQWFRGKNSLLTVSTENSKRLLTSQQPNTNITPIQVSSTTDPEATLRAGSARDPAEVVLRGTINSAGSLSDLHLLNGPAELGTEAMRLVQKWAFVPAVGDGGRQNNEIRIDIHFDGNNFLLVTAPN